MTTTSKAVELAKEILSEKYSGSVPCIRFEVSVDGLAASPVTILASAVLELSAQNENLKDALTKSYKYRESISTHAQQQEIIDDYFGQIRRMTRTILEQSLTIERQASLLKEAELIVIGRKAVAIEMDADEVVWFCEEWLAKYGSAEGEVG